MGLSNAERQKRYREKLKAAARGNAGTAKAAMGADAGRGAFVRAIADRYEAERADPDYDQPDLDVPAAVAESVLRILSVLSLYVRAGDELDRNEAVIIDALGGLEYAVAVRAWKDAKGHGRGKKRTNIPPAPPLPV
jgi:hypothetical protein